MTYEAEFDCTTCGKEFTAEWSFGDDVTCPHCQTQFETDYDEDSDCNITGPWLEKIKPASAQSSQSPPPSPRFHSARS